MAVRGPPAAPYVLRFELLLEEVEARFVTATIEGDLTGHAALDITPVGGDGSRLRLVSALAPANGALQLAAAPRPCWCASGTTGCSTPAFASSATGRSAQGEAPGGRGRGG